MSHTIAPSTSTLRKLGWGLIIVVFTIPVIAKLLVAEMQWSPGDFAVWAGMLLIAGALGEGVLRVFRAGPALLGGLLAIAAGFLLVWINLAVGFLGNEDNPVNLGYFAMLAVVLVGGLITRFRPRAMTVLMVFCAVVQAAMLFVEPQEIGFEWMATAIFCVIWLGAASFFRMATPE